MNGLVVQVMPWIAVRWVAHFLSMFFLWPRVVPTPAAAPWSAQCTMEDIGEGFFCNVRQATGWTLLCGFQLGSYNIRVLGFDQVLEWWCYLEVSFGLGHQA
jgi:hypothetical protein